MNPDSADWRKLKAHLLERIEVHRNALEFADDDKARGAIRELRRLINEVEPKPQTAPEILGPEY